MAKTPNLKAAKTSILAKLSPDHIRLSARMRWVIDSVTAQDHGARGPRGEAPAHLSITSDGFVQCGNMFLGAVSDMVDNISGVLTTIEATPAEREAFFTMYRENTTDWRG